MAFNTSPSSSVYPSLASLLASARLSDAQMDAGSGSTDFVPPSLGVVREGKSPVSFLSSLDAVAQGGGVPGSEQKSSVEAKGYPSLLNSSSLVFIGMDSSVICGGNVGRIEEKFCACEEGTCSVVRHTGNKFKKLVSGLYLRAPNADEEKVVAFKEPMVPIASLDINVLNRMMTEDKSPAEWSEEFSVLCSGNGKVKVDKELLKDCKSEVKTLRDTFTPGPKKRKYTSDEDVAELLNWSEVQPPMTPSAKTVVEEEGAGMETLVNTLFAVEEGLQHVKRVVPVQIKKSYEHVTKLEKDLETLLRLIQAIEASMGKPGKIFKVTASPTVWGNLASIREKMDEDWVEIDKVKNEFVNCYKLTSNLDANVNALTSILSVYDKMIKTLSKNVSDNSTDLKRLKTGNTAGAIGSLMAGINVNPSGSGVSVSDFENLKNEVSNIRKGFASVPKSVSSSSPSKSNGVSMGGIFFGGEGDVVTWIENHLPASFPFGAFIDIYGLMARFVAQKSDGIAR